MNLSEQETLSNFKEFCALLGNKKDARTLVNKSISLSMLRDIPDVMINNLEVEDLSKIRLFQRKRELTEAAQLAKEKEKTLRERKPKLHVPLFDLKDILGWAVQFRQYLAYEGAESRWLDFLRASLETRFSGRIDQALADNLLDSLKPWADNERHFIDLFLPTFSRVQVLRQLMSLRPKPGEILTDYCSRYQTFSSLFIKSDSLPPWIIAEGFLLSLPEFLQKEIKRIDPSSKEYDSLSSVVQLAMNAVSQNPHRPLVDNFLSSSKKQQPVSSDKFSLISNTGFKRRNDSISSEEKDSKLCSRCHNSGHEASQCYAKKTKEGLPLPSTSSASNSSSTLLKQGPSFQTQIYKKQPINNNNFTEKSVHLVDVQQQEQSDSIVEISPPNEDETPLESFVLEDFNMIVVDVLLNRKNIMEKEDLISFPVVLMGKFKEYALLDSGASASLLSSQFVSSWDLSISLKDEPNIMVRSFAGNKFAVKSILVYIQTANNSEPFQHKFLVVDMDWPVICGRDLIPLCKIQICNVPVMFPPTTTNINSINPSVNIAETFLGDEDFLKKFEIQTYIDANLATAKLPCNHPDSIINLEVDESKLKYIRQYPIPDVYKTFVDKQVSEWLSDGIIEPAGPENKWNNPILTVPKYLPTGEIDQTSRRVCMDARFVNEALITDDRFPVPIIVDIYSEISSSTLFTELDCASAYTQFEIAPESRKYLGITWNNQHYQFTRAIYGLKFMSSRFQRVMNSILSKLSHTRGYIDNILIHSKYDMSFHAKCIIETLQVLTKFNITISPSKCKFAKQKLKLLGHEISSDGIGIDSFKIHIVDNLEIPKTGPQLESHLGLFNYFRRFIPLYSKVAAPLEAIRKQPVLVWTTVEHDAWELLRTAIKNAPILSPVDPNLELNVATDASDHGLGAVLFQKLDGVIKYNEFASRALSPNERNYSATKLELSAIIFALDKFQCHLLLRPFVLYTDHSALVSLFRSKFNYQVLTNEWYEKIFKFIDTMKIVHCPGIDNVLPDLLSRCFKKTEVSVNMNTIGKTEPNPEKHQRGNSNPEKEDGNILRLSDSLNLQTVVDDQQKRILIEQAHSLGHFGARTVQMLIIKEGFYWTNMKNDILVYIDNCEECQKFKITREGFHPMKSIDARYPFEMIAMDLCGPLPETTKKNRYVLVVVDVATRFCLLRAIPDKFATTVAQELVFIMTEFGVVKILLSDNGKEFVNSLMTEIKNSWKIDKRTITPYYPQGNGISENKVKNVKSILVRLQHSINKNADNIVQWDQILPMVEMILNMKPNDTTKSSPFELFFGRPFVGFLDFRNMKPNLLKENEILERWKKLYEVVFPAVRKLKQKSQTSTAESFNNTKKVSTEPLKIGSVVMYQVEGLHGIVKKKPFDIAYNGPSVIERINKAGNYILRDMETGNLLNKPRTLAQLKQLPGVSPFAIIAMRSAPNANFKEYLVKFSNRHQMWISGESEVVKSLQEGEAHHNNSSGNTKSNSETFTDTVVDPSVNEDIVIHLEE